MKLQIESTPKIVLLNGIPARIWQGTTDSGIAVHCYVTRVAVDSNADCSAFETELQQHASPRPELEALPLRLIL